jgi:WD40 repeat protein
MLIDFRTFRDAFFYPIQFSAPHIYLSALPFASPTSMVSKLFLPNFPSLPVVQWSIDHTHPEHPILQFEGHDGYINCVTFSPDGKLIVSGSLDCTVRVWNIENSEAASLLFEGHEAEVVSIAVSPNGRYIASRAMDDTVRLWDIATRTSISKWVAEGTLRYCNTSISFTPDGKYILSASRHAIQLLNIETGEMKLKPFQPGEASIKFFRVAFSVDGQYIAFGIIDLQIQLLNIETGKLERSFPMDEGWRGVEVLSFSPDGKYIVAGSWWHQIRLWNIETGDKVFSKPINLKDRIRFVGVSPDGKHIVSSTGGNRDSTIQLWNAKTGNAVASKPFQGHTLIIHCASLSPNGKYIVTGSADDTIRLWKVETPSQPDEVAPRPLMSNSHTVQGSIIDTGTSFSPDGNYIACGLHDHTIRLWDVKTGEAALEPFVGHRANVISVLFSPDGKYIASNSKDNTIRLWNAKNGEAEFKLFALDTASISFSPDGNYIASSSGVDKSNTPIRLWNVKTGKPASNPFGRSIPIRQRVSISFSPDGNHINAAAYESAPPPAFYTFEAWNIKTGAKAASFYGRDIHITCVAFSPDGQYIATGYDVGLKATQPPQPERRGVRVWNTSTGEATFQLDLSNVAFSTALRFVAFSPDGKYILISSLSEWTIWQAWTTVENDILPALMPCQQHRFTVNSVSFSPNGKYIAYGSDRNTIHIYNNNIGEQTHHDDLRTVQPMFLHHYPTGSVWIDEDGWLRSPSSGELLLWVPPNLHSKLYSPGTVSIIGTTDHVKIELSQMMHGAEWLRCKEQRCENCNQ